MLAKPLVVICCLVLAVLAEEKETDKYDLINVEEILEKRLLTAYVDCMLDKGKCTPEGKELKEHIQDALETGCEKCSEKQKEGATTVIERLISHEKEFWDELCAKYDPDGVWRKKYEEQAREKGIIIPN
ncbi:allergen Tha p 1-like isoform X3 [Nymphalis io]|uniref:allergen Tha p 1-like isoform X3 n=1 Tax=Inachis io TaxID=171585 RepID=UPI00216998DB|nr:allergen Tha p 1-like isoform X3 [Nymphalis io]